jgi:hypothetical protein
MARSPRSSGQQALEELTVALEGHPQILSRCRLTCVPTREVHADLFQHPLDQQACLVRRTPRVIDEVALYLLPLGAQTDDVIEQARARRIVDGGGRIAVPATDPLGRRRQRRGLEPRVASGVNGLDSRRRGPVAGCAGPGGRAVPAGCSSWSSRS